MTIFWERCWMIHGIDTDFLVAVEIHEHPHHGAANTLLDEILGGGHSLAVVPQTLAEFIHVVTDSRRMPTPLSVDEAVARADHWWQAAEVVGVYPAGETGEMFLSWLREYRLRRKRLLDTLLAATFFQAGIRRIITNNGADYRVFGAFEIIGYT
jgi:predicted nucleic acid-binding protein